jgi:selenocysteine insertion sequence-binding protein 2
MNDELADVGQATSVSVSKVLKASKANSTFVILLVLSRFDHRPHVLWPVLSCSYTDIAKGIPPRQDTIPMINPWQSGGRKPEWNNGVQQQAPVSSLPLNPTAAQFEPLKSGEHRPANTVTAQAQAISYSAAHKGQSNKIPPVPTASKKRKPSLNTMSIGDLIPGVPPAQKKAPKPLGNAKWPVASSPKKSPAKSDRSKQSDNFLSNSDFPALSVSRAPPPVPSPVIKLEKHVAQKKAAVSTPKREPSNKRAALVTATLEQRPASANFLSMPRRVDVPGDDTGGEHDLLRLMRDGKMVIQNKGRQRIRPRKKKFSALKKKVLQERLLKWQKLHAPPEHADEHQKVNAALSEVQTCSVCVYGFTEPEELQDDEEYEEILNNLQELADKIGEVKQLFIPRALEDRSVENYPAFIEFTSPHHASAAATCWNGLVVGGQPLSSHSLIGAQGVDLQWRDWCLASERPNSSEGDDDTIVQNKASTEVSLENALTEDDMEDDECLEESVNDIRLLAEKYGVVEDIRVEKEPSIRLVVVYRGGVSVAQKAAQELGKLVIGGAIVTATVLGLEAASQSDNSEICSIILRGLLTEDDLEDDECLQESLNDIRELAEKYGSVREVALDPASRDGAVKVLFSSMPDGGKGAVDAFNGMVVGGQTVSASLPESECPGYEPNVGQSDATPSITPSAPTPLFSGDKMIPERFAECKRVPKVPNDGTPRTYATLTNDDSVKVLLIEMLGELMRLQRRAIENKNAKAKRRIVMGLREVARGIRSHKVKMVVMANNLDEYGVIDEKLQEILDLSHEEGIPVFFEFSKRGLGKAFGKTIKIAVAGIQNAEGAHQQFKKLIALSPKAT